MGGAHRQAFWLRINLGPVPGLSLYRAQPTPRETGLKRMAASAVNDGGPAASVVFSPTPSRQR